MTVAKRPLRVLFIATEMWPYASAGGLSRVVYYLPKELMKLGIDARVMIPKYGLIDTKKFKMRMVYHQLNVSTKKGSEKHLICNILTHQLANGPVTYFLENREYFELRANIYSYSDDATRWGLLQRGAWEFINNYDKWTPDIVHCNDWNTGLMAEYFQEEYKQLEKYEAIKMVFSVHNLGIQAFYDHKFQAKEEIDHGKTEIPDILSPKYLKLNNMHRALQYSDMVIPVSPTYAKEILTEESGEGLHELLQEVQAGGRLEGILNGLDYSDYNPATDELVYQNFRKGEWVRRQVNKSFLQKSIGLEISDDVPLFGISYRLTDQKGLDLIMEVIETIIEEFGAQLIVNGDGDSKYKEFFLNLRTKHPKNVGLNMVFDQKLPRQIFAGTDFMLLPSRFEPCGIVQLECMAYGCIPIIREVGGLADTVTDEENGFSFKEYKSNSLLITLARSAEAFKHKEIINKMRLSCMNQDFSWKASAEKYLRVYKNLLGIK